MQSDSTLVKKTLAHDSSAYGKLIRKYQDMVYGLAFHLVKNFADARDLTQESFLKAYLNLSSLRNKDKFASWLRRITVNVCKTWLSKQKTNRLLFNPNEPDDVSSEVLEITDQNPTPDEICEKRELQSMVREAIETLSEKNQLVVTLFYLNGRSYKGIANFLNITEAAVQSRLQRSRKKLKKEMLGMVEETFEEKKLELEFAEDTVKAVEELSEDLKEVLPSELLEYVKLSPEERKEKARSLFKPLRNSFPPEKLEEMEQKEEPIAVSELSREQREYLCRAVHKYHQLNIANSIVNPPVWISDFDNCEIKFGRYPSGGPYFGIFRFYPDGGRSGVQMGISED